MNKKEFFVIKKINRKIVFKTKIPENIFRAVSDEMLARELKMKQYTRGKSN